MSAPYEKTLRAERFDDNSRVICVTGDHAPLPLALLWNNEATDWERILVASPDMARALRAAHVAMDCACKRLKLSPCMIAAALTKAGVPLP